MDVYVTLKFSRPVSGQEIADAVKAVAGNLYHELVIRIVNDARYLIVGQMSEEPIENIAIAKDENDTVKVIFTGNLYEQISVSNFDWPDKSGIYLVDYDDYDAALAKAVQRFAEKLSQLLPIIQQKEA